MRISGVVPAVLTPFTDHGEIDNRRLKSLLRFLLDSGVHGLHPLGTSGEGVLLSLGQRKRVAEFIIREAGGAVPIIVHVGTIATQDAVDLALHAAESGAAAISSTPPYFFSLTDAQILAYFETLAKALPEGFPVYLYNIPSHTHHHLSPGLIRTIAECCPNVVGLKDSSGDFAGIVSTLRCSPANFSVLVGVDSLIFPALTMGVHGCISGNANVAPELFVALYRAYREGDYDAARRMQFLIDELAETMAYGNIAHLKAGLEWRGIPIGAPRGPLQPLDDSQRKKLFERLERVWAKLAQEVFLAQNPCRGGDKGT